MPGGPCVVRALSESRRPGSRLLRRWRSSTVDLGRNSSDGEKRKGPWRWSQQNELWLDAGEGKRRIKEVPRFGA